MTIEKKDEKKQYGNIEDYMARRKDVTFAGDPFNEVDSLVLCELLYADYRGIIPAEGSRRIDEVRRMFFAVHDREELEAEDTFFAKSPLLLDPLSDGARFGETRVGNYIKVFNDDQDMQISAAVFMLEDGTAYVCYSGTDMTVSGWKEDFNFCYMKETEGQRIAVQYLNQAAALTDRPLRVGGHSEGANFAVYASAFADPEVQDRIQVVYANDGPGVNEDVVRTENYLRIVPKVVSIVPEESIVGQILRHRYQDTVVKSSERGIMQHDGFTWCVEGQRFVRTELSSRSRFFAEAQRVWLSNMDDEAREAFVTILFAPLEATKMSSFEEMYEQRLIAAKRILDSLTGMPREAHRAMRHFLEKLIRSCGIAALENKLSELEEKWNTDRT